MAPIALGTKHQDLLKAYIQVSKTSGADWTTIATKADYPTSKYARDQWALVKSKLIATDNGAQINLADRQVGLLKATIEVMKTETDWEKVASVANVKTPKYARDQFAIIRNKLCGGKGKSDTASPSKTPTKPKAAKATQPRKRKRRENEDDDASQPSTSGDEASTPKAKKNNKARKVKVEETEAEDEDGEEPTAPFMQEQQAHAHDVDKLEPESDGHEESFFEAEMFNMD